MAGNGDERNERTLERIAAKLDRHDGRFIAMDARFDGLTDQLNRQGEALAVIANRLDGIERHSETVDGRLGRLEHDLDLVSRKSDLIERLVDVTRREIEAKLDAIHQALRDETVWQSQAVTSRFDHLQADVDRLTRRVAELERAGGVAGRDRHRDLRLVHRPAGGAGGLLRPVPLGGAPLGRLRGGGDEQPGSGVNAARDAPVNWCTLVLAGCTLARCDRRERRHEP